MENSKLKFKIGDKITNRMQSGVFTVTGVDKGCYLLQNEKGEPCYFWCAYEEFWELVEDEKKVPNEIWRYADIFEHSRYPKPIEGLEGHQFKNVHDLQDGNLVAFNQGYNEAIRIASLYLKEHLEERITGKNEVGDWECEVVTKPNSTKNVFIWDFEKYMTEGVTVKLKTNDAILGMIKDSVHMMQRSYSYFQWMSDFLSQFDNVSKNPCVVCQYDMDTCQGTPNFPKGKYAVNVGKKEYLGFIYDEFIQVPEDGYYTYDFVLVNNGKVIAIGNEQGRSGGVTYSCRDNNFEDMLKKSPVYDKVKHLPIATEDELEEPIYMYFNSHREYEEYMERAKIDIV